MGYEIFVKGSSSVTVDITGKVPTNQPSQSLAGGWHLLAAHSTQQTALSKVFGSLGYDQLLAFDASGQALENATQVDVAQAYYVRLLSSDTFNPPASDDVLTSFVYDGDGGRVKKISSSGTTKFLGQSYEIAPDGTETKYVFAGSQRIAAIKSSTQTASLPTPDSALRTPHSYALTPNSKLQTPNSHTRLSLFLHELVNVLAFWRIPTAEAAITPSILFYHTDHLGSSNVITNNVGAIVELNEHTPYGSLSRHEGIEDVPQDFTGQRLDKETSLHFYNARYYDSELGRFISPDPFVQAPSDPQTLNRYSYVRNNPINFIDPSGYFIFTFLAVLIAVLIEVAIPALIQAAIILAPYAIAGMEIAGATQDSQSSSPPTIQTSSSSSFTIQNTSTLISLDTIPNLSPTAIAGNLDFGLDVTEALVDDLGLSASVSSIIAPSLETAAPQSIWADVILFGVGLIPLVLFPAPDPFDAPGAAAVTRGATGLARRGIRVIGENMRDRVIPYAKRIGAKYYRARSKNPKNFMKNNREALRTWMAKGKRIIDIGPDKVRRQTRGPSPFYEVEKKILRKRGYPTKWDPQP